MIRTVGIIGMGQMGTGIAQVLCTKAKLPVLIYDTIETSLKRSISFIDAMLEKDIAKGKLNIDEKQACLRLLKPVNSIVDLTDTDMIIEAVKEDLSTKIDVFKHVCATVKKETILASNTSSISITKLAAATSRPLQVSRNDCSNYIDVQVIGMHFMNPVPVMPLVEVIKGLTTSEETLKATLSLAKLMGKTCTISKDIPGFIANRCLMPYINEAIFALFEGLGTAEDIDLTMKLGCNMPMGPLALADFIGLDTCLAIMKVLHKSFGDSKYRPCPLLVQYVDAGWLGKKTRRGFYNYDDPILSLKSSIK